MLERKELKFRSFTVWQFQSFRVFLWDEEELTFLINEKSRAGINGYLCIKNPLLWEWHFHKLLCEEIIFPLPSGKNDYFLNQSMISSLKQWKYNFFTQKFVKMPHLFLWDFSFILWKYLHFICFIENLRATLRKIYGHVPPGINGYFCIKKTLRFNGNEQFIASFLSPFFIDCMISISPPPSCFYVKVKPTIKIWIKVVEISESHFHHQIPWSPEADFFHIGIHKSVR